MGYNHHGLVFTINTLSAKTLHSGKTRKYIYTAIYFRAIAYHYRANYEQEFMAIANKNSSLRIHAN